MARLNPTELKQEARERLAETSANTAQLVLLTTGVIVAVNLLLTGANMLLNQGINGTGGLSGLGMRSVLQTAQTLMSYFANLVAPFLQAGFLYAMISIYRGQSAPNRTLLRGFQRFGRILSYAIWQTLIIVALCFVLMYLAIFLFFLTPLSEGVSDILMPLMSQSNLVLSDGSINMDLLPMEELMVAMIPLLVGYFVLLAPAVIFVHYSLRLTSFLLVEGEGRSAFAAMILSWKLMKGKRFLMFKLDLSFWWFYILEELCAGVLWLDVLLPMAGIPFPTDSAVTVLLLTVLYGVLELGLHLWKKPQVDVTYAAAYDRIFQEGIAPYRPPMPKT